MAERLGLRHISVGAFFRRLAEERGLTVIDLTKLAEQDPTIDLELDRMAREEAAKGGVVIDGHASPHLLKGLAHLRVAIVASFETRVRRLAQRDGKPLEVVAAETTFRESAERERFRRLYNIDIEDYRDFDLAINSERFTPEEIVEIIVGALKLMVKGGSIK